jgi:tRNA A-37 threonylcarbamoyl transferase component Bud32
LQASGGRRGDEAMRGVPAGYVTVVREGWRVWIDPGWADRVGMLLAASAAADGWVHRSKHARTRVVEAAGRRVYLKAYHRYRWRDVVLEVVRPTKAERAFRVSLALERLELRAPRPVACGVRRRWGVVRGAFLAAEDVEARDVRCVLAELGSLRSPADKRRMLRRLGAEVAALHEAGIYHGDLVPPNVRVRGHGDGVELVFMDHDRTRLCRGAVSLRRARRNLVQLNRFVVPALTATDRWRVFRSYARTRRLDARAAERLARRVVAGTVERRRTVDGIEQAARLSFRMLMRTGGPRA